MYHFMVTSWALEGDAEHPPMVMDSITAGVGSVMSTPQRGAI